MAAAPAAEVALLLPVAVAQLAQPAPSLKYPALQEKVDPFPPAQVAKAGQAVQPNDALTAVP
jgi:hypothetical protein